MIQFLVGLLAFSISLGIFLGIIYVLAKILENFIDYLYGINLMRAAAMFIVYTISGGFLLIMFSLFVFCMYDIGGDVLEYLTK